MKDLGSEYLKTFWNVVDSILTLVNLVAFILRMIWYRHVLAYMFFDVDVPPAFHMLEQQQINFQVVGFSLLVLRYIEMLTYIREVGEVWVMFVDMVYGTWAIMLVMLMLAIAYGVAISAAAQANLQRGGMGPEHFQSPWASGFWAAVGQFDVEDLYKLFSAEVNQHNWLPVLAFLYVFVTTIFLVNLMIAKMTSTYTKIETFAVGFRAQQYAELAINFKNNGPPPPLNLILDLLWVVATLLKPRQIQKQTSSFDRLFSETTNTGYISLMGRNATIRLQTEEQRLMRKYDKRERDLEDASIGHRVEYLQARLDSLEALLRDTRDEQILGETSLKG